ncbi:SusE domain-containing protein [Chryseobacterium sp. C39-AII1]|uniref:SusE domain-containing protein n=1 Tax=Chryseobacterium sp. C39-AII1 TaxID=3080332 RepID=UPI00320A0C5C
MKNIFKILLVFFLGFLVISCEDDDKITIGQVTASSLSSDKTSLVLESANDDDTSVTFNWTNTKYDATIVVENTLEFAIKGTDFAAPKSTTLAAADVKHSYTVKELNAIVLSLGITSATATDIEVRLKSQVKNYSTTYSNVINLTVTPYINGPVYNYTDLYLIGDATAGAWDNTATNAKIYPLQKSATTGVYSYTGYFAAGGFKMIKTPGSWDVQYGLGSSAGVLSTDGGSGNISVATAGYYKLTINIISLTYTFVSVTPPTTTYTSISMIGSASGDWNTDVDLQKNTFDAHIWVKKNVELKAGEFKFRANHDWGTNWGTAQEFFGVGDIGGGNIPVSTQFNYDVYFNDITGEFSFIPLF